jgi:transcriptional regulator with XRE-family HTH domain
MSNQLEPTFDGRRMRALRQRRGLSADGLAHKTGLTARHLRRMEIGKRPNTAAITLARVAMALGTTVEYLLGLTDDPTLYRSERHDVSAQP